MRPPSRGLVVLVVCGMLLMGSVGIVIALLVLEHVESLLPVFAESARVLASGGEVFLCELHPMRQLAGQQAEFVHPKTKEPVRVPAFLHETSEYVNAGLAAGFEPCPTCRPLIGSPFA